AGGQGHGDALAPGHQRPVPRQQFGHHSGGFPHPHGEQAGPAAGQQIGRESGTAHVAVHGAGDGGGVGERVGGLVDVVGERAADGFAGVQRFQGGQTFGGGADLGGDGVEKLSFEGAGHAPPFPTVITASGGPDRGVHFGGGSLEIRGGSLTGRRVEYRMCHTFL